MHVNIYICQHHLPLSGDWPIGASILGHASYILSECSNCLLQICNCVLTIENSIVKCKQLANGSLGKVISNYPLPMIDSILAHFNGCKVFSTIDLKFGYYHICFTKEAVEKTAFVKDKGKCIFHFLPFGINIGPSAFSYVLGKVSTQSFYLTIWMTS